MAAGERLKAFGSVDGEAILAKNYAEHFHKSRLVRDYLSPWGHRIVRYFLARYAPETNPIDRVWWRMHETVTRNHRCQTLQELVAHVYDGFEHQYHFATAALINSPQAS